ncbi:MAG: DUF2892 domain-containing protein [Armatimonadota bacterium]|nr:DUF2892 domain-containing protein [Armatimonadota bacterium]MDR7422686.1 DUF2892 domain-containing protein [Armatimonadota bacterium]MDR7455188.1 DUF2892 domain-containing protein [Armatimonadota bacterium]MDR7457411.1 DUF2892 domain-containing protein [Armatimonadota bacterium]MDR7497251.1 DUF2892 domain-containing protein [Armatimonadota bacterium]
MKRNMGGLDRVVRAVLGVVLVYVAVTAGGLWAWVAGVGAAVMLGTALVGFCPLYTLLGITTCPVRERTAR